MRVLKNAWQKAKRIFIILFVAQLLYIIILRWVNPPVTIIQLASWIDGYGLSRDYVAWEEISDNMKLAAMAAEDQLFPVHNGFDWKSIEKAISHNEKKPTRIRGASTISQQVAKNVFLWNGRSWFRKGLEVYFTFMIEMVWGKKRILEVYLNVAETGKGVFGVEKAARTYFKKSAKKLSISEAAQIAAALPNPKKYTVKPQSAAIQRRAPWVQRQMNNIAWDKDVKALLAADTEVSGKKRTTKK